VRKKITLVKVRQGWSTRWDAYVGDLLVASCRCRADARHVAEAYLKNEVREAQRQLDLDHLEFNP